MDTKLIAHESKGSGISRDGHQTFNLYSYGTDQDQAYKVLATL